MSKLPLAVVITGLMCAAAAVGAQTVGGRVLGDSSRRPIATVRVFLIDSATKQVVDSTLTDTGGVFYTNARGPGSYSLRFDRPGAVPRVSRTWRLASDAFQQAEFVLPEGIAATAYWETDVDKRAAPYPGSRPPLYPKELRSRGVNGNVYIQFVVDTTGLIAPGSLRILVATEPEFADAVRDAAQTWKFFPAERGGLFVPQIACMPLTFEVSGKNSRQLDSQATAWRARGGCPR